MVAILYAVVCLHHFCTMVIVPTHVSLTMDGCTRIGVGIASESNTIPKNWRLVGVYCEPGYDV